MLPRSSSPRTVALSPLPRWASCSDPGSFGTGAAGMANSGADGCEECPHRRSLGQAGDTGGWIPEDIAQSRTKVGKERSAIQRTAEDTVPSLPFPVQERSEREEPKKVEIPMRRSVDDIARKSVGKVKKG